MEKISVTNWQVQAWEAEVMDKREPAGEPARTVGGEPSWDLRCEPSWDA